MAERKHANLPGAKKTVGKIRLYMDYMLGKGGQGAVYRGEFNETGFKADSDPSRTIDCASKLLKLTAETRDKTIEDFNRELEVLLEITHPNIVKFYGWG